MSTEVSIDSDKMAELDTDDLITWLDHVCGTDGWNFTIKRGSANTMGWLIFESSEHAMIFRLKYGI